MAKRVIYRGTHGHPDSFRLAPWRRLWTGAPVMVDDALAALLLTRAGVEEEPEEPTEGQSDPPLVDVSVEIEVGL